MLLAPSSMSFMVPDVEAVFSPIKKGMWIQYQVVIDFDFPEVYYRASNEVMELTMLQTFYGIEQFPGASPSSMKYALFNVAGIKVEITDIIEDNCVTHGYIVMKDGSQEPYLGGPGGGTGFCDKAKENRSLKIGDDLLDRDVLFYSPAEGPMEFPSSMEVKEFSTVTINGKKIDVIVANGKEITYHSSGKSEVEVEVLIHRYTGLIIGLSFSGSASAGNERGTFSFSFFANDVSEHFTEKPILGAISQPISSIVSEPLYIIIGVVAIGGVIGAIAVAKRGSKTPKPAKQELDEYEEEYIVKQKPSRKPAEKKETSMFCTNCGAAFKKSGAKFCGKCGSKQ